MSITETPVTIGLEELDDLEQLDAEGHIKCCRADRFLCGADFHPEAVAGGMFEQVGDDTCQVCCQIGYQALCPPWKPTHAHCPIPSVILQDLICPDRKRSR